MNREIQKTDYQSTLNLPKTDFSMRAGLAQKEPQYLEKWTKAGLFKQIKKKSEGRPDFILHDGPPYANGDIHIGHALNKILKDFIVKYKTMSGHNSYYLPGWDCHGLPIEHQLLKEMKKKKSEVDCLAFRRKAHEYALKYIGVQREQFKRLGVFGEWDKPYLTLDKNYEYWILKSLAKLNEKEYIYHGLKPVNWCFNCETALAEAEVEYEGHVSKSVFVRFSVSNKEKFGDLPDKKVFLLIWTTTPWTLIANVAVSVHPEFTYVFADTGDEIMIVEKLSAEGVFAKAGIKDFSVVKEVKGKELTNITYQHAFREKDDCRVVTADYVTKEDGTGLVHTAPGHGQEDFETGLRNGLEVVMPVDDRGIYTKEGGAYEGEHVFKANDKIIDDLRTGGALFYTEDKPHSYPHCWRCKKPIIFRATRQWFLKIDHDNLRGNLVKAVQDVQWIPEAGEERIKAMVTTRPDWCLSRQRYWGVPIPALKLKKSGEQKLYTDVIEHFAEIVKKEGTDAWFEKDVQELIPKGFKCPETGETEFEKSFDILDVWFDSGVSHQAVVKAILGKELPIAMYLEGSDQHRGWFQSSLIPAVAMEGKAPYANVLTHGFVVDGQGRKMSKSVGNVISPLDIMQNNGADILRLWVAASSYNEDVRISKEILDRLIDAYRKIRNTIRYLLGNLNGFDPEQHMLEYGKLLPLDQWALHQLMVTVGTIQADFDHYAFAKAYKRLYTFCNEELSSFYLDILKDRLYTSASNAPERRSAQTVLYHILNCLVRVMAPILCFTAEEVFEAMPKDKETKNVSSVHLLSLPEPPATWINKEIDEYFKTLIAWRPFVMSRLEDQRREGVIGSSLEAKVIFHSVSPRDLEQLEKHKSILPSVFIVSQVDFEKVKAVTTGLSESYPQTNIEIVKADGSKCGRCWNYKTDIGSDRDHPNLCARCAAIAREMVHQS